jgi:hypothetical protein
MHSASPLFVIVGVFDAEGDTMKFDVFISDSHQEKAAAYPVCTILETAAVQCWIVPRDVPAGAQWAQ